MREHLPRVQNRNFSVASKGEQIQVTAHDYVGLAIYRAGEDDFIVRVANSGTRYVGFAGHEVALTSERIGEAVHLRIGNGVFSTQARIAQRAFQLRQERG